MSKETYSVEINPMTKDGMDVVEIIITPNPPSTKRKMSAFMTVEKYAKELEEGFKKITPDSNITPTGIFIDMVKKQNKPKENNPPNNIGVW